MLYKELPPDTCTDEERDKSYRHWAKQSDAAKWNETWRLSVEHYGMPIGDLCDGPVLKYQRLPDGSLRILAEWAGTNALRYADAPDV